MLDPTTMECSRTLTLTHYSWARSFKHTLEALEGNRCESTSAIAAGFPHPPMADEAVAATPGNRAQSYGFRTSLHTTRNGPVPAIGHTNQTLIVHWCFWHLGRDEDCGNLGGPRGGGYPDIALAMFQVAGMSLNDQPIPTKESHAWPPIIEGKYRNLRLLIPSAAYLHPRAYH